MSHSASNCSGQYVEQVLNITEECARRGCKGTMTEVWVQYTPHGPIKKEKECSTCGKVRKKKRPFDKQKQWSKDNAYRNRREP